MRGVALQEGVLVEGESCCIVLLVALQLSALEAKVLIGEEDVLLLWSHLVMPGPRAAVPSMRGPAAA